MNPNQQELFRVVLRYIDAGRYIELAIYLLILYLPFAPVVIHWIRTDRKISRLYNERLADKDREIERQALRIKDLENALLKTRRR
jgi:hypothetical protein